MSKKLILAILLGPVSAWSLTAKEIMEKYELGHRVTDVSSHAVLKTGGGERKENTKEFTSWRKLNGDGIHYDTLTRFHVPAEVRNQGILFKEAGGGKTDIQMYLPTYKKVRRVETGQQSGSFMGSEFSYSDITTHHVNDHNYRILKEENCPQSSGVKCFVIEGQPANDDVKERSGVSKSNVWIRTDNFTMEKAEYFDLDGKFWKRLNVFENKMIDSAKQKWMAIKLKMESEKTHRYTSLEFSDIVTGKAISDSVFTVQNLQKE